MAYHSHVIPVRPDTFEESHFANASLAQPTTPYKPQTCLKRRLVWNRIGAHICRENFWRVVYPGCQSHRERATGDLVAADRTECNDRFSFEQAVQNHLTWRSLRLSCFLSVFSDKTHAINWAKKRDRAEGDVQIISITTETLPPSSYVFNMSELQHSLDIDCPFSAHEYLFLYRIPSICITKVEELAVLEERGKVSSDGKNAKLTDAQNLRLASTQHDSLIPIITGLMSCLGTMTLMRSAKSGIDAMT